MEQLKALNNSVSKWIEQHVSKNPCCILTPIFTDYEMHLADIEKKFGDGDTKSGEQAEEAETSNTSTSATCAPVTSSICTPITSTSTICSTVKEEEEKGSSSTEDKIEGKYIHGLFNMCGGFFGGDGGVFTNVI